MASIITALHDLMFSSEFVRLTFFCPDSSMTFSISDESGEIFSQTYYPDDEYNVTLYDLDKLLESYIDELYATFTFSLDGTAIGTVEVIMCRAAIGYPAISFAKNYFFTTSMGERDTALGRHETLTAYIETLTPVGATCTYLTATGAIVTREKGIASYKGWAAFDVSPERFKDSSAGRLLSYVVQAGARRARYRVLENPPEADPAIIFRNNFNCWETIYFTGSKQTEPSYTRSTAVIDGQNRVYDIQETMQYKALTGPLRPGMVPVALDLARSKDVYVLDPEAKSLERIYITEVDVKHTNEDNEIPDFAFTYRLADRQGAKISVVPPTNVFDNTFDDTFD